MVKVDLLCDCCGREIGKQSKIFTDYIQIKKIHRFGVDECYDLCEDCWQEISRRCRKESNID